MSVEFVSVFVEFVLVFTLAMRSGPVRSMFVGVLGESVAELSEVRRRSLLLLTAGLLYILKENEL